MRNNMDIYTTGNHYDDLKDLEMTKIDITDDDIYLYIGMSEPAVQEVKNFRTGDFQVELAYVNGIIFFLFKFGTEQWMDVPYNPHLSQYLTALKPVENDDGYLFIAMLWNSINGEVKSIGFGALGNKKSKSLKQLVENEMKKEFNINLYHKNLKNVYARFSIFDLLNIKL
jgi:hypothetical protein